VYRSFRGKRVNFKGRLSVFRRWLRRCEEVVKRGQGEMGRR
jgi:hypothetical protein